MQAGPAEDREVLLPFTVRREPVRKLALLDFAKGADPVYESLEPQYLDRGDEQGFRVIAYRTDGYVDIYDDLALTPQPDDPSRVTGKGRLHYRHVDLGNPTLQRDSHGRVQIAFALVDVAGRQVRATIREQANRPTTPLNLLAPVGRSAVDPEFFPLFLLHDFDFIRRGKSELEVTIDGRRIELAAFPVPLPVQGQRRTFAKYTVGAELLAVFPTSNDRLARVRTDGDCFRDAGAAYVFDGANLERIEVGSTRIVFAPALDLEKTSNGRLTMASSPDLGRIAGPYRVKVNGPTSRVTIAIDDVAVPRQRGLLYRLIVRDRSVFGRWPRAYRYEATIDRDAATVEARWVNDSAAPG